MDAADELLHLLPAGVGHGIVGGEVHVHEAEVLAIDDVRLDHGTVWLEQVSELLIRGAVSHVPDEKLLCSFTPPVLSPQTRGYFYFHLSALEILTIE